MPTNERPALPARELDDPTIPVLTERLTPPPLDIDVGLPQPWAAPIPAVRSFSEPPPAMPPAAPAAMPATEDRSAAAAAAPRSAWPATAPQRPAPTTPAPSWPGDVPGAAATGTVRWPSPRDWDDVERELREAVLHDLSLALPQTVESIVREKMQPGIEAALDRLAIETRVALAASLGEIIDRAVKTHLDALRRRRG